MTKKELIFKLREQGLSYREIERQTGINRSLIAYYCNGTTKTASRKLKQETRDELRRFIAEYKTDRGCKICGETHPAALDFHHLKDKKFNLSDRHKHTNNKAALLEEMQKCEILCANCHRKQHYTK